MHYLMILFINYYVKKIKTLTHFVSKLIDFLVPTVGIEPTWISPKDFESFASTSFTTWASGIILNYQMALFNIFGAASET